MEGPGFEHEIPLGVMRFCLLTLLAMAAASPTPDVAKLKQMSDRFAPVRIEVDLSKLSVGDRKAATKLVEAARVIDDLFLEQFWKGNKDLQAKLAKDTSPLGRARYSYFRLNKSPWSALDGHTAFLSGVPEHKPAGANFYPETMTKESFEGWLRTQPEARKQLATGFFSVIHQRGDGYAAVPFSREYASHLKRLASLLREAAASTENATLQNFLTARAAAFLSNDYYSSDVAWMDLDAPLDVTIGPYETYNDELFGYKASFEAYINIRDDRETEKVKFFSQHLQEIEDNLPVDPKFRNKKLGASAPIRVVNEIISTGDAAHGVRTAAYNLPNDERVVREKGSKRVMLKNIQEAKFRAILEPIADRVLRPADRTLLSFDSFFTHILAHELTHGIGPHTVSTNGVESTPRKQLKEFHSAIEEAKADVLGLFMLQYMMDRKMLPDVGKDGEKRLYTTFLASSFRTLRFGLKEAHGKGMALQFNYLSSKGGFRANADGTYFVDMDRIKPAIRDLAHDLLTIEATGDYNASKRMLESHATIPIPLAATLERLRDLPTDIYPDPVTANGLAVQR